MIKIEALSITKKIINQIEKDHLTTTDLKDIEGNKTKVLGWIWSEDAGWSNGYPKTLVCQTPMGYKLFPYHTELNIPTTQIFVR